MRKIMKRGFCLFLVAVLLAGLVPYAFADEAKPTDVSEDAAEPTEETTAPPETTVPSESTEPPSEATEPPVTTEATEPDADPVEDDMEDDRLLSDSISTYASTVSNVLLFDQASPNYTTVLKSQISVTYQPNGTDAAKTAYIKNLGWHFARYNNTPYEDDPIYCIEPCKNYAASTSGNYMDQDLGVSGSGSSRGSNVWYAMPSSYRQAIALTLLYSKQLWNSNYSVKTTAMANNPKQWIRKQRSASISRSTIPVEKGPFTAMSCSGSFPLTGGVCAGRSTVCGRMDTPFAATSEATTTPTPRRRSTEPYAG